MTAKESSGEAGIFLGGDDVASNNISYGNVIGIEFASTQFGATIASGNTVYNNTGVGISVSDGDIVTGNDIYSNGSWGIQASLGFGWLTTISNNLVYGNTGGGISVSGGYGTTVLSNTVYQAKGDALQISGTLSVDGSLPGLNVENNILWTQGAGGYDMDVSDDGSSGNQSREQLQRSLCHGQRRPKGFKNVQGRSFPQRLQRGRGSWVWIRTAFRWIRCLSVRLRRISMCNQAARRLTRAIRYLTISEPSRTAGRINLGCTRRRHCTGGYI